MWGYGPVEDGRNHHVPLWANHISGNGTGQAKRRILFNEFSNQKPLKEATAKTAAVSARHDSQSKMQRDLAYKKTSTLLGLP